MEAPSVGAPRPFEPLPWTRGGHRQTLLGFALRHWIRWTHPTEDIVVGPEADVRLLVRASWQSGPRETRPALILVHGMGGSDASGYLLATARLAWARGWHVLRMNMRGSGDSVRICPRLYNAGLDGDVVAVLEAAAGVSPRVGLVGFSLGASLALLALGRRARGLPAIPLASVAVSPPLDLGACADALERPENRLYQGRFMADLLEGYRQRQRRLPDLYEAGRERGVRTVRAYDDRITAPYGGYEGVEDYYARSSSGPFLAAIDRPTLVLAAADDPMIPAPSLTRWPLSPSVRREVEVTGGHVGFVARTRAPGRFWAAERALDFLEAALPAAEAAPARP